MKDTQKNLYKAAIEARIAGEDEKFKELVAEAIAARTKTMMAESYGSDIELGRKFWEAEEGFVFNEDTPTEQWFSMVNFSMDVSIDGGERASRESPGASPEVEGVTINSLVYVPVDEDGNPTGDVVSLSGDTAEDFLQRPELAQIKSIIDYEVTRYFKDETSGNTNSFYYNSP